jgi:hypothetical protein
MMDNIISMFIDDELSIEDKIEFVERIHADKALKQETVDLLQQEKVIGSAVVDRVPQVTLGLKRKFYLPLLRPINLLVPALAAAMVILFLSWPLKRDSSIPYRFVIYRPDVSHAELTGSFTDWRRVRMKRIGETGYWEVTLNLPKGEHRFTYILEGHRSFADPTIQAREQDDFGGENSILLLRS